MAFFQNTNTILALFTKVPLTFSIEEKDSIKSAATAIILTDTTMNGFIGSFISQMNAISGSNAAAKNQLRALVQSFASSIFSQAVTRNQSPLSNSQDDRPLYWTRNRMIYKLKEFMNSRPTLIESALVTLLEKRSRGYDTINFGSLPATTKKILITGFDPFQLDTNPKQSNPSGASALYLHNKTLSSGINSAKIQCAIVPVRYGDFDNGVIDGLVDTYLFGANKVDMVVTISQGSPNRYDVERFAGKFREPTSTDNLGISGNSATFYIPSGTSIAAVGMGVLPEFLETTLPFDKMVPGTFGNLQTIFNQKWITAKDEKRPPSLHVTLPAIKTPPIPPTGSKSKEGSGSNYLSNEIFYRVALLRTKRSTTTLTGHLHVPKLQLGTQDISFSQTTQLVQDVENMIRDAISGL